jgi:hypothetical protein
MLFDLVKHPNMQLASKYREDVLGVFVASHLSAGECAYLLRMIVLLQLITSFCVSKGNLKYQ